MNLICIVAFILLACCTVQCKQPNRETYFIGQLEYAYTYESTVLDTDSLRKAKAHKSIFRFDLHNYQSRFIGKDSFTDSYSGRLNKAVAETNSRKDYACADYSIPTDSILSYKLYDTDEKVWGHACRILEFRSKLFWNRYYISRELSIAPDTWQQHKAYNWSFYGEKTGGGLILKLEHRFPKYTMKGIVTALAKQDHSFKALELDDATIQKICN